MNARTKARSNSKLHALTPEQRELLDIWLFRENIAHQEVAQRCCQMFKIVVGQSVVGRYSLRERPRWELDRRAKALQAAREPSLVTPNAAEMGYRALLTQMIRVALDTAHVAEDPAERRVVCDFARVLISARRESHEALRAATTREKFEFDASTACLIHQVKVQAIAADRALDDGQRIQKIRRELFGVDLPEADPPVSSLPDSQPPTHLNPVNPLKPA